MNPLADTLGVARELRREIDDELFERTVFLFVAEVWHGHGDVAGARFAMGRAQAPGMRPSVSLNECRALGPGKMADLENDCDVLCRYRHQIARISDLGHERAVLAQRRRQLQARPRRPVVEHPPQDGLVVRDIAVVRPVGLSAFIAGHGFTVAIVALSQATATGDTESVVSPVASSVFVRLVSAAASPQNETSTPRARAASTVRAISASTAGLPVSLRSATAPMSRAAAIVYCVKSFEPIE